MSNVLNAGLPKPSAEETIADLKKTLYYEDNMRKFFPDDKKLRYEKNFDLFDRNQDKHINLSELEELLVSIGQELPEEDLVALYNCLENPEFKGINFDSMLLIVSKKIREDDREATLTEAFRILEENDAGFLNSEIFKELLMTMGHKWTEEQADKFIEVGDPKKEGKFMFEDFVKKYAKDVLKIK